MIIYPYIKIMPLPGNINRKTGKPAQNAADLLNSEPISKPGWF
jgi:hypothetical protein